MLTFAADYVTPRNAIISHVLIQVYHASNATLNALEIWNGLRIRLHFQKHYHH